MRFDFSEIYFFDNHHLLAPGLNSDLFLLCCLSLDCFVISTCVISILEFISKPTKLHRIYLIANGQKRHVHHLLDYQSQYPHLGKLTRIEQNVQPTHTVSQLRQHLPKLRAEDHSQHTLVFSHVHGKFANDDCS